MLNFKKYIIEDASTDARYRSEATRVYTELKAFFDNAKKFDYDTEDTLKQTTNGGYFADLSDVTSIKKYRDKINILLLPKDSSLYEKTLGEFGFFNNTPIIVFYVLDKPGSLAKLFTKLTKELFIHEFIHYLDWFRYSKDKQILDKKPNKRTNAIRTFDDYINSPEEFNAYYQETISNIESKRIKANNFKDFLNKIATSLPVFFMLLNTEYRKKLIKRLYSYYTDKVK